MLISCNKILDCLYDNKTMIELFSVGGNRVCLYYTDIVSVGKDIFIEIPICAIDSAYMMPDRHSREVLSFSTKDKSIRSIYLTREDHKWRKQGYLYIRANRLFRII
jgi:hypothetical protein